jgi:signal transduction histidine kinase
LQSRLTRFVSARHLTRRTVRLRLTLLYGGLFLISGIGLLGATYVLFRHSGGDVVLTKRSDGAAQLDGLDKLTKGPVPVPARLRQEVQRLRADAADRRHDQLRQLFIQSGIALGFMSALSIALGSLVAGRILRPLRTMTVTTRRISEDNLHERLALVGPRDELKDLGDTIDDLLARLEDAFDAQRRFVANASHELRTPLAMMRTSVDVAAGKPGPVPPQVTMLADRVREGLDQADRLLESFLALARAQHGSPGDLATVSLDPAIRGVIEARRELIDEKGIRLQHDIGDGVRVRGSRTLLARLLENVIDNAIRHNERPGWIRIEARTDDDTASIVIENGGPRLHQHDAQELAQPFRRLGGDRVAPQDGVGLGLSIVAAIAAAHHGTVELAARPQGGLKVRIRLPCAHEPAAAGSTAG